MKNSKFCKTKFFIVVTLAIVLVGMALVGIFGFGGTSDYPNDSVAGYEVVVSVNHNAGDAVSVLKTSSEEFFKSKGIQFVSGATQELDKGKILIYKFTTDVTSSVEELETFVGEKLTAADLTSVKASAEINVINARGFSGVWWLVLACGIAVVAIFIYALIMEKLAGALATVFSGAVAALLFISLLGITRISAAPFVAVGIAMSVALACALAVATVNRFKVESKNSENASLAASEVADKVLAKEKTKYVLFAVVVALAAIALAVFMLPYLMIAGVQLLIAGLSATFAAYFGSAFIWAAVKGKKK